MKKKQMKIPGLFRKKFKRKTLNKKILKRIHIPKDRELVESLFVESEKSRWVIKQELSAKEIAKLKGLAKSIKKNKGLFTTWKLVIVLVPLVLIILFNLFFMNSLVEKGAESALEAVFQADSDLDGVALSLLKGSVIFESLVIADKDDPMINLIETGRGTVNINMRELAFKRFHIEEVSLLQVRWNTHRESSGALPEEKKADSPEKEGSAVSSLGDFTADFDYKGLLESRKDELKSIALIEDSSEQIRSFSDRWTSKLNDKEKEIEVLRAEVSALQSIDVSKVRTPEEIQSLIGSITSLKNKTGDFVDGVKALNREFKKEKDALVDMGRSLTSTLESDLNKLSDLLDFGTGDFKSLASDLAEEYIRTRWNDYYTMGKKAWGYYEKFGKGDKEKEEKEGIQRLAGRNIPFPSPDKPEFLINTTAFTGSLKGLGTFEMTAQQISNEPDKVADPLSLNLNISGDPQRMTASGILDLRSDSEELFNVDVEGDGFSLSLDKGIPALSIEQIDSDAVITGIVFSRKDSGIVTTDLEVDLNNIAIKQSSGSGFLHEAVGEIFAVNDSLTLNGQVLMSDDGIDSIDVSTDFDKILSDSVGEYLDNLKDRAQSELESTLNDYLDSYLEENEALRSALNELGIQSTSQISSVSDLERILDNKKSELENRANAIVEELKAQAQAEADRLKAQAQAEAEAQAENALDKAKDSIKLPGF